MNPQYFFILALVSVMVPSKMAAVGKYLSSSSSTAKNPIGLDVALSDQQLVHSNNDTEDNTTESSSTNIATTTTTTATTTTSKSIGGHQQHPSKNKIRGHHNGKPPIRPHPGRHVCTREETVTRPLQVVESYCKPVYKSFTQRCTNGSLCTAFRVQYDTIYRTVVKYQTTRERKLSCCPGWSHSSKHSHGCMQPVCSQGCKHGGTCIKPEVCQCLPGYTGPSCETDVDECSGRNHQCQQSCINTMGSYICDCHDGFKLEDDRRSCKFQLSLVPELKQILQDYQSLSQRLTQLEQDRTASTPEPPTAAPLPRIAEYEATVANLTSHIRELEERLEKLEAEAVLAKTSNATINTVEPSGDSFQSLSDQISILEERLADCTCTSSSDNQLKMNRKK